MKKEDISSTFLTVGTGGDYIVMDIDIDAKKLVSTDNMIHATSVVPFGLNEHAQGSGGTYIHVSNRGLDHGEVAKKSFYQFLLYISQRAIEHKADYVLVSIKQDMDKGTYWLVDGHYQLLVKR